MAYEMYYGVKVISLGIGIGRYNGNTVGFFMSVLFHAGPTCVHINF